MQSNTSAKKISAFQLSMITLAYVASLRVLPSMAQYGLSALFYYFAAMAIFFVPSALISAELATMFYDHRGGVYVWVKEALGQRLGFLAIWLQFFANILTMPAYLTFIGATFAYLFAPNLANSKLFLATFIIVIFWLATFISFFGMEIAGWINTFAAIIGTYVPLTALILLGFYWIFTGHPSQVPLSTSEFFPHINKMQLGDLVFLAAMLFSLTGMETSGAHVMEVKDAKKNYPKGMLIAIFFVAAVGFGAVSVSLVVPQANISLAAGIMQAFDFFLQQFHLHAAVKVISFMIFIGALAGLNSSVIGPSKGLLGTAKDGNIPPFLVKLNSRQMPTNLFIFQATVVSIFTATFLLMPSVNSSYWLIAVIMTVVYLCMYILLFTAAIVLRYKLPHFPRFYRVPGGKIGMWILGLLGIGGTIFGIFCAIIPPSTLNMGSHKYFEVLILIGSIGSIGLGVLINLLRKPEWAVDIDKM